jgi:hypothetical protein
MFGVRPKPGLRLIGQTCPGWGLNMSGSTFWNPEQELDKSGWDLAAEELGLGQTCSVQEPDMSGKGYWNPAWNPDKPG